MSENMEYPREDNNFNSTIYRVDERTKAISNDITLLREIIRENLRNIESRIEASEERTKARIDSTQKNVSSLEEDMKAEYVKKTEFSPIQKLVYGLVGIITTAVVVALLSTVIQTIKFGGGG